LLQELDGTNFPMWRCQILTGASSTMPGVCIADLNILDRLNNSLMSWGNLSA